MNDVKGRWGLDCGMHLNLKCKVIFSRALNITKAELMNPVDSIWGPFSDFPVYPSHILAGYAKCQELSADEKKEHGKQGKHPLGSPCSSKIQPCNSQGDTE